MSVGEIEVEIDLLDFFEHLFFSDEWHLSSLPSRGLGWRLADVQKHHDSPERCFVIYERIECMGSGRFIGVDIEPEIVHAITQAESLSDF